MKKRIVLLGWVAAVALTGCGKQPQGQAVTPVAIGGGIQEQTMVQTSAAGNPKEGEMESGNTVQEDAVAFGVKETVEGYQLADGTEVPVTVTFWIESAVRGEEAYALLSGKNPELGRPEEGLEYVVVEIGLTYEEGDSEYLNLSENHASLSSASLYFALSDGDGNARQVTELVENPVYDLIVEQEETAKGQVAFLHKALGNEPLVFLGYNNVIKFRLQ